MNRITIDFLQRKNACAGGVAAFIDAFPGRESVPLDEVVRFAIEDGKSFHLKYANWLLNRCMTQRQRMRYAIFASENALPYHERRHPKNKTPRNAINAAKMVLKRNTEANRAAALAAYDAIQTTDDIQVFDVVFVAYAAYDCTYAAYAVDIAYSAAVFVDATYGAATRIKILAYGIGLKDGNKRRISHERIQDVC